MVPNMRYSSINIPKQFNIGQESEEFVEFPDLPICNI